MVCPDSNLRPGSSRILSLTDRLRVHCTMMNHFHQEGYASLLNRLHKNQNSGTLLAFTANSSAARFCMPLVSTDSSYSLPPLHYSLPKQRAIRRKRLYYVAMGSPLRPNKAYPLGLGPIVPRVALPRHHAAAVPDLNSCNCFFRPRRVEKRRPCKLQS